MPYIHVKITNPTARNRAYGWFPRGLTLMAGKSIVVDFDPLSKLDKVKGLAPLCKKDIEDGNVTLEYKIDAPCMVVKSFDTQPAQARPAPAPKASPAPPKTVGGILDIHDGVAQAGVVTPDSPPEDKEASANWDAAIDPETIDIDVDSFADLVSVPPEVIKPKEAAEPPQATPADEAGGTPVDPPAAPAKKRSHKKKTNVF